MILSAMTGKENWQNHAAKLHVFVSPRSGPELHIGVCAKDQNSPISHVRSTRAPARPGYRAETGEWTSSSYDVPEGTILKIFGSKSAAFGSAIRTAHQFVQMRQGAALMRVNFALSVEPSASYSVASVQGNFDLLTLEEATMAGARTLPQFAKFSSPELIARTFTFEVLTPALTQRPRVEKKTVIVDGKPVDTVMPRRSRAMQF